jgi:valyl-tRNA synthetase
MARFVMMHLGDERPGLPGDVTRLEDRFVLSRLARTIEEVRGHLDGYNFNLAAEALYEFTWHDFCDWYLEMVKPRLQDTPDDGVKGVLHCVLSDVVKMLHPIVPFITEEIWQVLGADPASVSIAEYPVEQPDWIDEEAERSMTAFQELVTGVRAIRSDLNVAAKAELAASVRSSEHDLLDVLRGNSAALVGLTGATEWSFGPDLEPPEGAVRKVLSFGELFVPLADVIDIDAERTRLRAELAEVEKDLSRASGKLANEQFLKQAPADVVEKERAKQQEFQLKKGRLEANLASLGG